MSENKMSEIEINEEPKTARILHLALQQGDTGALDLMDRIWGDTVYERLYKNIEETTEKEKNGMLEELGESKPLGDKSTLDLMDQIWGDTVYKHLYKSIEETTEKEKNGMLEKLGKSKSLLKIVY